ncbi:hypothetical protein UR09_02025 [Candidatus Nitromaritima sp. SCGC AAA799-A02]|nr:hypothetical protein UZ36_04550 [Candidatus Nitromaritima sp. SCGC AAA799-C22]KMP11979.1 hypothetical protein UR09_02025 [Candidatus Nitromaritima sp. SCGC AAA799-A02]
MSKGSIVTIVFLAFIGYLSFSMIWTGSQYQCNICVEYKGLKSCQKVKGMDKQDTVMTGISTACAAVTNGRTESIDCSNTPPIKMECEEL